MLTSKKEEFTSVDSFKLGPLNILQQYQVDCAEDAADKDDDLKLADKTHWEKFISLKILWDN